MKLRSFSSERGLIEDDDVRDVCGVAGGVEVEVEDGGVHHPLDCLVIDVRGIRLAMAVRKEVWVIELILIKFLSR